MRSIIEALGDNAKFYPNYMANHLASDFKFHLDNGIGRILENNSRLTKENTKLREALEQSSEVLRRQLSQYYYKDEVAMLNQYESNKQLLNLLNQLKEQKK